MIYLSLLLHIYQPPTQDPYLTKKITRDSYRLLIKILNLTKTKVNINIPASLTEQLMQTGGEDVVRGLRYMINTKQIEITHTAAYHPILPLIPEEQIRRQILLNTAINSKYLGSEIARNDGFFPPEMAYSTKVDRVLEDMGYKWVILDEMSYTRRENTQNHQVIYIKKNKTINNNNKKINKNFSKTPMKYFFRDEELSLSMAFSGIKTLSEFKKLLTIKSSMSPAFVKTSTFTKVSADKPAGKQNLSSKSNSYYIIALDGETFGHHQPGQDKLLFDILRYYKDQFVTLSELGKYIRINNAISPLCGSWGIDHSDLRKKIYYPKWSYPHNSIHKLQWELLKLAVNNSPPTNDYSLSTALDRALHSDQFWWASRTQQGHPEMIEKGARMLKDSIYENNDNNDIVKKEAESLYCDIVAKL